MSQKQVHVSLILFVASLFMFSVAFALQAAGYTIHEKPPSPGEPACPSTITVSKGVRATSCYIPYLIVHPFINQAGAFVVSGLIVAFIAVAEEARSISTESEGRTASHFICVPVLFLPIILLVRRFIALHSFVRLSGWVPPLLVRLSRSSTKYLPSRG